MGRALVAEGVGGGGLDRIGSANFFGGQYSRLISLGGPE